MVYLLPFPHLFSTRISCGFNAHIPVASPHPIRFNLFFRYSVFITTPLLSTAWLVIFVNHCFPLPLVRTMRYRTPTLANIPYHPPTLYPVRSFRTDQVAPLSTTSDAPTVGRLFLYPTFRLEKDCEQSVENAGNGCGASAYAGRVEKLCFERQMQLDLVGAGGIGVASRASCAA
jgi:hypothetical protein